MLSRKKTCSKSQHCGPNQEWKSSAFSRWLRTLTHLRGKTIPERIIQIQVQETFTKRQHCLYSSLSMQESIFWQCRMVIISILIFLIFFQCVRNHGSAQWLLAVPHSNGRCKAALELIKFLEILKETLHLFTLLLLTRSFRNLEEWVLFLVR